MCVCVRFFIFVHAMNVCVCRRGEQFVNSSQNEKNVDADDGLIIVCVNSADLCSVYSTSAMCKLVHMRCIIYKVVYSYSVYTDLSIYTACIV